MTWLTNLIKVYDDNQNVVGKLQDGTILLPIGHIFQSAQIEVLLNKNGESITANVVDKTNAPTMIPATIESSSRSGSKNGPHPLHDSLQYVAGDFTNFVKDAKPEFHEKYIDNLKKWSESKFSHPIVESIYKYLSKKTLISDLVKHGVLYLEDNQILEKWGGDIKDKPPIFKVVASGASSSFVRFKVDLGDDSDSKIWFNQDLQNSFINYYSDCLNKKGERGICFVTGDETVLANSHPRGIRYSGDSAKIISSNQSSGFVYKGVFENAEQAMSIGYIESQKAHNALRWLVKKQGFNFNGKTFLVWGSLNQELPSVFSSSNIFLPDVSNTNFTNKDFADRLRKAVAGVNAKFYNIKSRVAIMILDAATPGRLAVTFYTEISEKQFIDRIVKWHVRSRWKHTYFKDNRPYSYEGVVSPKQIAIACYGDNLSDSLLSRTIERITYCIINAQPIPKDLMTKMVDKASRPIGVSRSRWEKNIQIACSLFKNYNYERKIYDMSLDLENTDRDYLYGRLLAVADRLEDRALYISNPEDKGGRETNAMRYMAQFSRKPYRTWESIYKKLTPYQRRLKKSKKDFNYVQLINEIMNKFNQDSFTNNKPLSGLYLLGFYQQRSDMMTKSQENNQEGEKDD